MDPKDHSSLLDSLIRSGYLMESRIVDKLNQNGFIVEPNVWYEDGVTGIKREIDAVAEVAPFGRPLRGKLKIKTHFVLEAVNNKFPLVLLTRRHWTPNDDEFLYKHWISPYDAPFADTGEFLKCYEYEDEIPLHAQYCTFTKKKGTNELMACHPEDLHSTLSKLTFFCSDQIRKLNQGTFEKTYWRIFYWRPVVVLQNDLLILESNDSNGFSLQQVQHGKLLYHYTPPGDPPVDPSSIIIDVVTEQSLIGFMKSVVIEDDQSEEALHSLRVAEGGY